MSILLPETQKRINELKNRETEELAENQRQNEIAHQYRLASEQDAKDTRESEIEIERANEVEKLKAELKSDFMRASPSASDEDFERLYPELRDNHLVTNAEAEYERQLAAGRRSYNIL